MQLDRRPIVVGVDGTDSCLAAIEWATYEATSRGAPLRIVASYQFPPEFGMAVGFTFSLDDDYTILERATQSIVDDAVALAKGLSAEVQVTGTIVQGDASVVLLAESLTAERIVLGSRRREALKAFLLGSVGAAVVGHASCPVLICRATVPLTHGNAVVVGVDASEDSQTVLEVAFAEASNRDAHLIAVMCRHPGLLEQSRWFPQAAQDARTRVEVWLSEALSGWQEKYPEVTVESRIVEDHPVSGLVAASDREQLLIVGSRGHSARTGSVLGSVSQGVLHHATTSVLVVPTSVGTS